MRKRYNSNYYYYWYTLFENDDIIVSVHNGYRKGRMLVSYYINKNRFNVNKNYDLATYSAIKKLKSLKSVNNYLKSVGIPPIKSDYRSTYKLHKLNIRNE